MIGIRSYGRYVDDFVIVLEDKSLLKELISTLGNFLNNELHLTLHPKKIYLQHYSKDVPFLGTMIKPGRIYIGKRTKSNFYQAIQKQNAIVRNRKPTKEEQLTFQSSMNLYLRIMKHYNTYKLRKKMLWKNLSAYWWNHVYLSGGYAKFVLKRKGGK
jgi:RNA-directed DNA polymerase